MFVQVKLLNGFQSILTYRVPKEWDSLNLKGSIVQVPLKKRIEIGYIYEVFKELSEPVTFTIRYAKSIEPFPEDSFYHDFIKYLSKYYSLDHFYFIKRLKFFLKDTKSKDIVSNAQDSNNIGKSITLTKEQQIIINTLKNPIEKNCYFPSLIHGVTGSGKTEVYKKLITKAYNNNKSSLLLLPEVSLAVQFYNKLKQELDSSIKVYSFHSSTSVKEKKALWKALLLKESLVIIGVHLPLLLPIVNLGLIIIDEEHEIGYQEKKHPKINTKEAAILRAKTYNIPIVLGSATPSLSSIYNVHTKNWHFFELKKRFAGNFPTIKLIKLTNNTKAYNKYFFISRELEKAIHEKLYKKEQILLFLNRRGFSFFVQCKNCGEIDSCINCSVSLTLHEKNILRCHYCDYQHIAPTQCPKCKASEKSLLKKGIGTQQIVTILEKIYPTARIARADIDSTINKKKWQKTIHDFESGSLDILVGTQTITKGYHFPKVTLVGVLWADLNLNFPTYNAAEVTLQQLIQVAGRAGRQTLKSEVIVQTLIDHPIYNYINEINYPKFYDYEIEKRNELDYPPFMRFADIELKSACPETIDHEADKIIETLQNIICKKQLKVILLGPTQPPVHMIKKIHIRKIYLKADDINNLIKLYQSINQKYFKSKIFFTPNPLS